jgi:hypothetical protein
MGKILSNPRGFSGKRSQPGGMPAVLAGCPCRSAAHPQKSPACGRGKKSVGNKGLLYSLYEKPIIFVAFIAH